MPRTVAPKRVAKLQRRYLREEGASRKEIRRFRPLLTAQIGAESNFTQGVGSSAGARDIAQFMPTTAPSYGVTLGDNRIKDDIRGQVRYMLPLLRKYGREGALRGYNAGPGAIEASKGFTETNAYVDRIFGSADDYRGLAGPGKRGPQSRGRNRNRGGQRGLTAALGFDPGVAQSLGLGGAPVPPQALVPSSGLQAPAHSAQATMPEGFAGVPASGGGPAPRTSLADALQLTGQDVRFDGGRKQEELRGLGGRGPRKQRAGGEARSVEELATEIGRFAEEALGLKPGSRDRNRAENAAVGGSSTSDHLEEGKLFRGREGVDIPTTAAQGGWGQYRKIARELGIKPASNGFTEATLQRGAKEFRVELIFGDAHGHGDHIHVGFRRIK